MRRRLVSSLVDVRHVISSIYYQVPRAVSGDVSDRGGVSDPDYGRVGVEYVRHDG